MTFNLIFRHCFENGIDGSALRTLQFAKSITKVATAEFLRFEDPIAGGSSLPSRFVIARHLVFLKPSSSFKIQISFGLAHWDLLLNFSSSPHKRIRNKQTFLLKIDCLKKYGCLNFSYWLLSCAPC